MQLREVATNALLKPMKDVEHQSSTVLNPSPQAVTRFVRHRDTTQCTASHAASAATKLCSVINARGLEPKEQSAQLLWCVCTLMISRWMSVMPCDELLVQQCGQFPLELVCVDDNHFTLILPLSVLHMHLRKLKGNIVTSTKVRSERRVNRYVITLV
eukprot:1166197-Amphidinium_carterae.1